MTSTSSERAAGGWLVRATREMAGHSETAESAVKQQQSADSAAWRAFTGAKAWLSLAESFLKSARHDNAIAAAQSGIKELGDLYKAELAKDDTKLKLLAAEEQRANGALPQAAQATVRVLRERLAAFPHQHKDA